ncbi:MAG: phosphatidate cytidylyltransferase, partial [Actinomycetota bacterium]|nr:phosphatidate cytidylyltransferase [Actinomycetota bacterium]
DDEGSEESVTAEIVAAVVGDDEVGDGHVGDVDVIGGDDDTGELEVVESASPGGDDLTGGFTQADAPGFGDPWNVDDDESGGSQSSGASRELFDLSQETYVQTATREHEGLAESIALADEEETQQVALAAPIPGLDATVVGFEDVVKAEGHHRVRAAASGDLVARIVTGLVLAVALGASLLWRPALVAFFVIVFVLGAGEFYTALVRSGRKPIALFGFVGIIGASLGAFFLGALSIPISFIIATTMLLLFYAVVPGRVDPMGNLALTVTVMAWVGLGSFALLIARADSYRTLIAAIVVVVVAMDVAQYFFGRLLGRRRLAKWVSPNKTVEGLVAGVIAALSVGSILHFFHPLELTSGLAIGAAVAVFSPIGDLAMSAAKRSLGLKDMGSVLPGHGGFLDRIDGLLFVVPAAWVIFLWAGVL